MSLNFTNKFMKNLRLSLGLNELQMASRLDLTVEEYSSFEEKPLLFGGEVLDKYLGLLNSIPEADNLSSMFMEFAKFDLKTERGAVDIFARYPLRLVEADDEAFAG